MINEKTRILIVDDNIDFCYICASQLKMCNEFICCGFAHNGEQAIEKLEQTLPDIVILDFAMPIIDGLGVLEFIKSGQLDKIPKVLAVSASGVDCIEKIMIESGADYFLVKPIATDILIKRIKYIETVGNNKEIKDQSNANSVQSAHDDNDVRLNKIISKYLIILGFSTKLLGYEYIQKIIYLSLKQTNGRSTLSEQYNAIAEQYESEPKSVENAISSAIKTAIKCNTEEMKRIISLINHNEKSTVSNGKLLTIVVQTLKYDLMSEE